ncbi:iron complex transport system substrate-binding protein [Streptosporangium becharense]|uniref:Iron complex transport system substrate-binding protein n=1 Tax=Streptosporangium becharense TaxID=1816182 RepID=A0A7W9MI15_9ACTN|nr:iron-siderophore ABC transporter substrate-binding protein [Streptosporangium becharense]MBB2913824.1 iron complex transport system substrate-binding protein [Streptosporangium becharense]MBB5821515.1 iron complex transport system substrate-binding protein [Streptosporangium becharense]
MRAWRSLTLGAVGAVLSVGLAACGSSTSGTTAEPAGSTGASAAPGAAGTAYPRTVKHAMGETEIPAQPKRVVALDQSFVDAVLTLDTEVVGYTTYRAIEEKLPDYLAPVLDQAKQATSVGTLEQPSLERIVALKPDLIVSAKVRHEALYDKLSQIAPTVFSETTGGLWKENLRLMGKALGKEDLAEQRITAYQERAAKIGESIKAKDGELPTISVVRFAGEPTVRLYVENSYVGLVLKDAGFPRPKDQPTVTDTIMVPISQENIAQLDADHIFVTAYLDPAVAPVKEKFEANPLWGKLKGTKHEVSDTTWISAVGLQGAHAILDDVAKIFEVDPAKAA